MLCLRQVIGKNVCGYKTYSKFVLLFHFMAVLINTTEHIKMKTNNYGKLYVTVNYIFQEMHAKLSKYRNSYVSIYCTSSVCLVSITLGLNGHLEYN